MSFCCITKTFKSFFFTEVLEAKLQYHFGPQCMHESCNYLPPMSYYQDSLFEIGVYTHLKKKGCQSEGHRTKDKLISGFLCKLSKKYECLIAKIHFFDSVRVWLYLTVSKMDFNGLVITIMHFLSWYHQCPLSF
jgi:hypothetical protein